jgi:hypothetical protein
MTNLSPTFGSPSMKSIEISAHTWDGTSSGCSNPAGWRAGDFVALARGAGAHPILHQGTITWNVKIRAETVQGFLGALMTRAMGQLEGLVM